MTDEVEFNEVEEQAMDKGWRPREEWDGEPDLWVDAGEFIRRGELMDRISDQTKQLRGAQSEIESLKKDFKSIVEHNKKIAAKEYEKAMRDLKAQKAEAIEDGEAKKVIEIDDRIDELKEARRELDSDNSDEVPNTPNNQQLPPEVIQWKSENPWYEQDLAMQGAAEAYAADYIYNNPQDQGNLEKILGYVTAKIKTEFPDRVGGKRTRPSATTDTTKGGTKPTKGGKTKYTVRHLNEEQRSVAKRFADSGVMTMQEYVDQLAELGEIE